VTASSNGSNGAEMADVAILDNRVLNLQTHTTAKHTCCRHAAEHGVCAAAAASALPSLMPSTERRTGAQWQANHFNARKWCEAGNWCSSTPNASLLAYFATLLSFHILTIKNHIGSIL
jgi:hypothetical protein